MPCKYNESSEMSGRPHRLLLDTNAVVAVLRGHSELCSIIPDAEWIGISIITQIEFLAFPQLSEKDAELFIRFMAQIDSVNLTAQETRLIDTTIQLRKEHHIKLPDAIIVASSIINGAQLISADRRLVDFAKRTKCVEVVEFTP